MCEIHAAAVRNARQRVQRAKTCHLACHRAVPCRSRTSTSGTRRSRPTRRSCRTPVAPRVLESCLTPAVPLGPRVLEHSSAARTPAEAQWYGRDPIRTGSRSAATPSACATRRTSRTSSPASSVSTYAGRYHPLTTTPATIVLREYRTVRPNQSTADGAIARQAVLVFAVLTVPLPRSGAE